jgi:hypothetical protein
VITDNPNVYTEDECRHLSCIAFVEGMIPLDIVIPANYPAGWLTAIRNTADLVIYDQTITRFQDAAGVLTRRGRVMYDFVEAGLAARQAAFLVAGRDEDHADYPRDMRHPSVIALDPFFRQPGAANPVNTNVEEFYEALRARFEVVAPRGLLLSLLTHVIRATIALVKQGSVSAEKLAAIEKELDKEYNIQMNTETQEFSTIFKFQEQLLKENNINV